MVFGLIKKLRRFLPGSKRPGTELIRLIKRAHQGQISVEELVNAPAARGRRAALVAVVAEVLMDLKQQRADRAALQQ